MERYLITGATGLIGSAIVKHLNSSDCRIICPVRNIQKAKQILGDINLSNVELIETELIPFLEYIAQDFDYIIHCASPTASKYFVEHPVETLRFNIDSTEKILDYCVNHNIKGMVYLSSLESYGTVEDDKMCLSEEFQGYVNPLNVRSSYNIAKRTCESLCHAYANEFNLPIKIARLTQTISSQIQADDMRVFAQFARLAAYRKDIELHTDGQSSRQYVYIDDAIDAIFKILHKGCNGEAYNVANESTYISVKEMAEFVQRSFNPGKSVIFKCRDDMGYAPTTKIRLDTSKLKNLGWEPHSGLYEMYKHLIGAINTNNI